MKTLARKVLFVALLSCGSIASAEQPQVGDIFDADPGQQFRGWHLRQSGLGLFDQPYSVFDKGGSFLLVLTTPLVRTAKGGIAVEKINKVLPLSARVGEEVLVGMDCSFIHLMPALVFYNPKTKIARGVFAARDEMITKEWIATREQCQYSGD